MSGIGVDAREGRGVDGGSGGVEIDAIDIKGTDGANGERIGFVDVDVTSCGRSECIDGGIESISCGADIIPGPQDEIIGDDIDGSSGSCRSCESIGVDTDGVSSGIKNISGCGFDPDRSGSCIDECEGDILCGVIADISISRDTAGPVDHGDGSIDGSDVNGASACGDHAGIEKNIVRSVQGYLS